VEFVRSFTPKVNEPLPTPLLTLSLEAVHGEVQIAPHPDDLKMKILELIDDVTKVTSSIMSIEYELVPFCNLPQHLMFELQPNKEERKAEAEASASSPADEVQLLRAAKAATAEVIEECLHGPRQVQASYQEYAYLFKEEVAGDMDPLDVEAVREKTDAYLQAGTQIEKLMTEVVKFPLFELHCMDIIQQMSQRAYHLAGCCLQTVAQSIQERSQAVLTEWHETHEHILSNPEDEEELAKLKQFMSDLPQLKTKPLMQTTRHIHTQINMLADFSFQIDNEVVERAFSSFAWPLQIQIDVGDSERSLDSQKQKFMEKLDQEKTEYERDMASYQEDLEWLRGLNDYSLAMKCAHRIYSLKENLEKAVVRVQSFVDRERLFGMEVSDYSAVEVMSEAFEPYYKLWNSAIDFKHSEEEWLQGVVQRLVAEEIEAMVEEQYKESYKTMKQFEGNENPLAVAKDLREEISNFRANMPVIRALCQE
ncbi:Dnah1, partial [Symbiodinium necroappetens]